MKPTGAKYLEMEAVFLEGALEAAAEHNFNRGQRRSMLRYAKKAFTQLMKKGSL